MTRLEWKRIELGKSGEHEYVQTLSKKSKSLDDEVSKIRSVQLNDGLGFRRALGAGLLETDECFFVRRRGNVD